MYDRQVLFATAGFLLRRMNVLTEETASGRRPLAQIQAEAQRLQRKWRSVIKALGGWERLTPRAPTPADKSRPFSARSF
jgi:hypothetical protein